MSALKTTTTIRCTPENAKKFQEVVKAWPELHSLVKTLQQQNLFAGLRSMKITLTGDEKEVSNGLDSLLVDNSQKIVLKKDAP